MANPGPGYSLLPLLLALTTFVLAVSSESFFPAILDLLRDQPSFIPATPPLPSNQHRSPADSPTPLPAPSNEQPQSPPLPPPPTPTVTIGIPGAIGDAVNQPQSPTLPPPPTPTVTIGIPGAIGDAVNLPSFTGGRGDYPTMIQESLEAHNKVRAQFGEAPLQWDKDVAQYAKRWLEPLRTSCQMIHSQTNSRLGENLFFGTGWLFRASDAIKLWASEAINYDPKTNTCAPNQQCGHYTQVVWNSTSHVGCARVECFSGGTLFSCNYSPPGNWEGQNPFVN